MSTTERDAFAAATSLTITLAGLASSTSGAGRQSTAVDNTSTGYRDVVVYYKLTLGTSPTAGNVTFYLIRRELTNGLADDAAGASDAAITVLNAPYVGVATTLASPATGNVLEGSFVVSNPGPNWALAVVNSTGVALSATAGNHLIEFVGINPTFA